jgi:hypothetical protein
VDVEVDEIFISGRHGQGKQRRARRLASAEAAGAEKSR